MEAPDKKPPTAAVAIPAAGDWFAVTPVPARVAGSPEWHMERVVLWMTTPTPEMEYPHRDGVVLWAVGQTGQFVRSDFGGVYFVAGSDPCPDGRTWGQVWQASRPDFSEKARGFVVPVTEQAAGWKL